MTQLGRTPLFEAHRRLGARIVPFAGFEMPVQYGSILDEHRAVREAAGLFDVSHMGQLHVEGPRATEIVERLVTCRVDTLRPGRVRYGCLCNDDGGVVDDVTVYRLDADAYFLCVNAANIAKDRDWIEGHTAPGAAVHDRSSETGLLALQGPASRPVLEQISGPEVGKIRRFRFERLQLAGHDALVSRTGYTGSDGFEIYLEARHSEEVFEALLRAGEPLGLRPAGLGARDTLRLEAALPLYGHELDDTTSPLEARLDRFVKLDRGGFIGAEAIERRRQEGHPRVLVGFELLARGVARAGHVIQTDGQPAGTVTSGAPSPTLGKCIGLGYVPPALETVGSRLEVVVRERGIPARVVPTPFVSR